MDKQWPQQAQLCKSCREPELPGRTIACSHHLHLARARVVPAGKVGPALFGQARPFAILEHRLLILCLHHHLLL